MIVRTSCTNVWFQKTMGVGQTKNSLHTQTYSIPSILTVYMHSSRDWRISTLLQLRESVRSQEHVHRLGTYEAKMSERH